MGSLPTGRPRPGCYLLRHGDDGLGRKFSQGDVVRQLFAVVEEQAHLFHRKLMVLLTCTREQRLFVSFEGPDDHSGTTEDSSAASTKAVIIWHPRRNHSSSALRMGVLGSSICRLMMSPFGVLTYKLPRGTRCRRDPAARKLGWGWGC